MILANQPSGFFNQTYLKKECTCTILIFFHADRHINNKETNRKPFAVRYENSQGMQKMTKTRDGKNHIFKIVYHWLLIGFDF